MKKLIALASATILAAATTQAASLAWGGGIDNMNRTDGNDFVSEGSQMVLFLLSDSAITADNVANYIESYDYTEKKINFKDGVTATATLLGDEVVDDTGSAGYGQSYVFVRADADGGVNGNWLVLFYDAATSGDAFIQNVASVSGVSDNTGAGDITSYSYSYTRVDAVPEPTTVALLTLGLAAVGLKRKVA